MFQRTFGQLTLETRKSIGAAFFCHKQGRPMPSFTPKVNLATSACLLALEKWRLVIATFAVSRRARRRARCGTASMRPCSDKPDHSRLLSQGCLCWSLSSFIHIMVVGSGRLMDCCSHVGKGANGVLLHHGGYQTLQNASSSLANTNFATRKKLQSHG